MGYYDAELNIQQTEKSAVDGNTIISTIDANLQRIVQEKVEAFSKENNIECHSFDTMKPAIIDGYQNSSEGDVILLSPACASWDQYKKFEDRGNEFKEVVNSLK